MRILIIICLALSLLPAQVQKIKFATLAPEGSTWMNVMKELDAELQQATAGGVQFKIYAGGVQGDEKDVLRKMRINQLHSAGFTGVGLGEILPEVRVLDAPFLFRTKAEVDFIAQKYFDHFAAKFEQKGYILLGWAEVGFVYIYTNQPAQQVADFKGVKMWMWEGDPLAEATFKAYGISPIPLSITDVLTSLQTGLIDGVYTAPLACVALQWFTRVKYVLDMPLANSNGAVLLSKRQFNKLTPDQQQTLRTVSRKYLAKLTRLSRADNMTAAQTMQTNGMQIISVKDALALQQYAGVGRSARQALIGKLYPAELLQSIEKDLEQFRANPKGSQ